jgi:hypothetical protein
VHREVLGLRVDLELIVPRDDHVVGRVPPGRCLLEVGSELGSTLRIAGDAVRGLAQVLLREEVRVHVVVGESAVLVGPGDAVDAEASACVVVAERAPEPRRLDEELDPDLALELLVAGRRSGSGRRRRRCRRRCGKAAVPAGQ